MQSQPFYPLTIALALHLTPRTYDQFILLRLFIAGFGTYLFLRLFVSFYPAMAGGIACMLAGYYILFLTIPELSVGVLLPVFLLSGEQLIRKQTYPRIVCFAGIILLILLGGAPETTLLLFTFSYLYFVFRIISDSDLKLEWFRTAKYLVLASFAGAMLCMFVILPFLEYLPNSWNNHEPKHLGGAFRGLEHDRSLVSAFTYIFPLLFGPVGTNLPPYTSSAVRNYFGVICFLLAFIAASFIFKARLWKTDKLTPFAAFFAVATIVMLLKRFGLVVNYLGALPGFRLLDFPRYQELLLSFSVAVLAAIGLERLMSRSATMRTQYVALVDASSLFPWAVLKAGKITNRSIFTDHMNLNLALRIQALGLPACLLVCAAAWLIWTNRSRAGEGTALSQLSKQTGPFFVLLVATELCGNYIYPVYHKFSSIADSADNPYKGAPYINFLKPRCGVDCRVIGQDEILAPNWAAAFQIFDVRYLDALFTKNYFPFLQNFFPDWRSHTPELSGVFRGFGDFDFTNPLTKRLLQLSSVRYILAARFFAPRDNVIDTILQQNRQRVASSNGQVVDRAFNVANHVRRTLGEHPRSRTSLIALRCRPTNPIFISRMASIKMPWIKAAMELTSL